MTIRHVVASNVVGLAGSLGARVPAVGRSVRRGLTVFLFHDVTDRPSPYQQATSSSTTSDAFARQVAWIDSNFHVVHPVDLVDGTELPPAAALITFDDAWRGVATTAAAILSRRQLPALLFLNMGTVNGAPDLGAVAAYEAMSVPPRQRVLPSIIEDAAAAIDAVIGRYGDDPSFQAFQGEVLDRAVLASLAPEAAGFGSHLFHHWRSSELTAPDFERSFRDNEAALAEYPNSLPLFAFPFGARHRDFRDEQVAMVRRYGARRVFTAHGGQNAAAAAFELDRLWFTDGTRSARACWYRTHGERLRGALRVGRSATGPR